MPEIKPPIEPTRHEDPHPFIAALGLVLAFLVIMFLIVLTLKGIVWVVSSF